MDEIIKLVKTYRLTPALDQKQRLAEEIFRELEPVVSETSIEPNQLTLWVLREVRKWSVPKQSWSFSAHRGIVLR